jgi:hypothetical protein
MTIASRASALIASLLLAALVVLAGTTGTLHAQAAPQPPQNITAIGCLAQLPDSTATPPTGHEQAAAKGLALTRVPVPARDARAGGEAPRSAVPGSRPSGSGTGTTDVAAPRTAAREEQSFWIVGSKAPELLRLLGRRVEVTGVLDDRLAANPGNQSVTDAGAAAPRRSATAPADPPSIAHPSAPTRAISVDTFRALDDRCS